MRRFRRTHTLPWARGVRGRTWPVNVARTRRGEPREVPPFRVARDLTPVLTSGAMPFSCCQFLVETFRDEEPFVLCRTCILPPHRRAVVRDCDGGRDVSTRHWLHAMRSGYGHPSRW